MAILQTINLKTECAIKMTVILEQCGNLLLNLSEICSHQYLLVYEGLAMDIH